MAEKPAFDPNKAFQANKPAFDPSQPFDAAPSDSPVSASKVPGVSKAEAALRGYGQGATLGYGDEGSGALESLLGAGDALLTGSNNFGDEGHLEGIKNLVDNYRRGRNTVRDQNDAAEAAHPYIYKGSELVGGIPTAIATAGESEGAQGGTLANRILQGAKAGAKSGAKYGGVIGLGASKSDLTDPTLENYGQAALDTALGSVGGAATGGVIGGATPVVGDLGTGIANWFKKRGNESAVASLGGGKAAIKKLMAKDRIQSMGQFLNDEANIKPWTSRSDISDNLQGLSNKYGKQVGDVIEKADNINADQLAANPAPEIAKNPYTDKPFNPVPPPAPHAENFIDPSRVAEEASTQIIEPLRASGTTAGDQAADAIQAEIKSLMRSQNGEPVSLDKVQKILKTLRDTKGVYARTGETEKQLAYEAYYNMLRDQQGGALNALDASEGVNLGPKFKNARTNYAQSENAQDLVSGKLAAEAANRYLSPTDYLAGAAGYLKGGQAGAAALTGANHLLRRFGNQSSAWMNSGLGNAIASGVKNMPAGADNAAILPIYQLLHQKLLEQEGNQ